MIKNNYICGDKVLYIILKKSDILIYQKPKYLELSNMKQNVTSTYLSMRTPSIQTNKLMIK